jgi:hypothetical protein
MSRSQTTYRVGNIDPKTGHLILSLASDDSLISSTQSTQSDWTHTLEKTTPIGLLAFRNSSRLVYSSFLAAIELGCSTVERNAEPLSSIRYSVKVLACEALHARGQYY